MLIARLSAVETLGATSVILTDKTGTLTENRMAVTEIRLPGADVTADAMDAQDAGTKSLLDGLLTIAALCNNASVLTRPLWIRIGLQGTVISLTVLSAMAIAVFYLQFETDRAVTVSFCTLAFAQLWHVFNMRGNISQVISNEITRNIWVWIAIVFCVGLILTAIYSPLPSELLKLTDPGIEGWLVIVPMSLIPLFLGPLVRHVAEYKPVEALY